MTQSPPQELRDRLVFKGKKVSQEDIEIYVSGIASGLHIGAALDNMTRDLAARIVWNIVDILSGGEFTMANIDTAHAQEFSQKILDELTERAKTNNRSNQSWRQSQQRVFFD